MPHRKHLVELDPRDGQSVLVFLDERGSRRSQVEREAVRRARANAHRQPVGVERYRRDLVDRMVRFRGGGVTHGHDRMCGRVCVYNALQASKEATAASINQPTHTTTYTCHMYVHRRHTNTHTHTHTHIHTHTTTDLSPSGQNAPGLTPPPDNNQRRRNHNTQPRHKTHRPAGLSTWNPPRVASAAATAAAPTESLTSRLATARPPPDCPCRESQRWTKPSSVPAASSWCAEQSSILLIPAVGFLGDGRRRRRRV